MAVVFVENTIEIAVIAEISGRPHVNVWHYRAEEGIGTGDDDAVRDFANNWQDHMLQLQTGNVELQRFEWRSLDPDDANAGVLLPDPAKDTTGAWSSVDAASPQVAALVHKNTLNRPRGRRDGRAFLSGVDEESITPEGRFTESYMTSANTALQGFFDGVTDDPVGSDVNRHLVVLETTPESRAPGTQSVSIGARRVTSLTLDPVVATQRDRLR